MMNFGRLCFSHELTILKLNKQSLADNCDIDTLLLNCLLFSPLYHLETQLSDFSETCVLRTCDVTVNFVGGRGPHSASTPIFRIKIFESFHFLRTILLLV